MALTQGNLDALVQAWATGSTRVVYGGNVVEYRTQAELESAIARTALALGVPNPLQAATPPRRYSFTTYSRG